MPRKVIAYLALLATLVNGCASAPPCPDGERVAEFPAGEDTEMTPPRCPGTYGLYSRQGPPEVVAPGAGGKGGPPAELGDLRGLFCLAEQGPVGFEKGEDGQLFAVVGEEKFPLPPGRYCWRAIPEPPAPGPELSAGQKVVWALHKTGETVSEVVLITVIICFFAGVLFAYVMAAGNEGRG
jgi:hypothetical protein